MGIQLTKAYVVDGRAYSTVEEAQRDAIHVLLHREISVPSAEEVLPAIAQVIVENALEIMDILSTKKNSRPSARKINGASKRRKKSSAVESEPTSEPQPEGA